MIFHYIKLKNFCPYYDEQTIQFATEEDRNVTVIRGVNGTGKTSLLTALNWCLYGDSFFKENTQEFVNRRVVAQGENVDTSVEIGFVDQKITYTVLRKCKSLRNDKTTVLLQKENEPPDLDAAATDKIRSMIPEDVSSHFFFDGEKIDNFARQGNEDEIKSAVHNVLRIELFDRGMSHLDKVAQHYQSKLKRYVPEKMQTLISERQEKQELIQSEEKKVEDRLSKLKIARKHEQDIYKVIQEYELTREFIVEQKELLMKLKSHGSERDKLESKKRELANDGFIPLAQPVIQKALDLLQKNKTPAGIPDVILNDLLEQLYCLCGRSIDPDSSEYRSIQNLIKQNVNQEYGFIFRETKMGLRRLLDSKVEDIPITLKSIMREEDREEKEIEAVEVRIEEIEKLLKDSDDVEFQKHQDALDEYKNQISFLEGEISQIREKISEIKIEIESLDKKINSAESLKVEAERLKRCRQLALDSAEAMKKLYDPHEKNIRSDLETEVSDMFKKLVWKNYSFREVRLTQNYELQVIDRYDGQVSTEISAGEREVLSLAFIAALAIVAVKEKLPDIPAERFPIVMDAPFTKLSDKPKENITEIIPSIANQLILFVTDQELRPDEPAWRNLEPRIGAEYELIFDDEMSVTKIKHIR